MSQDDLPAWARNLVPSSQDLFLWVPTKKHVGPYMWAAKYLGVELTKEEALSRIEGDRNKAFLRFHYLIKHPEFDLGVDLGTALRVFAVEFFPRGKVFHSKRWQQLRPRFEERRRSRDSSFADAWRELVEPAVLAACRTVPDSLKMRNVFTYLRKETRKAIERDLLDGQTLDMRLSLAAVPSADLEPVGDESNAHDAVGESFAEEESQVHGLAPLEAKALVHGILSELSVADARLLYLFALGYDGEDIAAEMGTTPGAVRTRLSRLLKRIRDSHKE